MKKIFALLLVSLFTLFSIVSCGEKKDIVIDINELASKLDGVYEGTDIELVDIEGEAVDIQYGIKGLYDNARVKGSITITSDEYVIIECFDEESAEKVYDIINDYRTERIKLFSSYASEQVPKLESSLLKRAGKYVVFVVADNDRMVNDIWKGFVE